MIKLNEWQQKRFQKTAAESKPFVKRNDFCAQLWYKNTLKSVSFSILTAGILLNMPGACYWQALQKFNLDLRRNREILAPPLRPGSHSGTLRHHPYYRGTL
jgi:hypothetical protein